MIKDSKRPSSFKVFQNDLDEESYSRFSQATSLAVDTEAMGLIHGRDRLCLVQICDPKDNVVCIKIGKNITNSPRLKNLMENASIQKVFHYARFDVAALAINLNIAVNPIFCTKIASKIGRTYSPRHGLKELVLELIGIELDKQSQSSDWGKIDSLSDKQLEYAANDVLYLLEARDHLETMLIREGRWELTKKCFKCIPTLSELDIRKFTNIFDH